MVELDAMVKFLKNRWCPHSLFLWQHKTLTGVVHGLTDEEMKQFYVEWIGVDSMVVITTFILNLS
jgi:hypothetical protein